MHSLTTDLDGPVHYIDYGGTGAPLVLVHGLGGSHLNWGGIGPSLSEHARVLAPDLAGFGRTPLGTRSSDLYSNRRLLSRFIDTVVGEPVVLAGNSMGGLISLLHAALQPEQVRGLVLIDAALPRAAGVRPDPRIIAAFSAYAIPGVGERFVRARAARLGAQGTWDEFRKVCTADPNSISEELSLAHVAFMQERMDTQPWAHGAYLAAARSLLGILMRKNKFAEMVRRIEVPALIVHGEHDRLVPVAAARELHALRPDWSLEVLSDIGHVPQLEAPEVLAGLMVRWLEKEDLLSSRKEPA